MFKNHIRGDRSSKEEIKGPYRYPSTEVKAKPLFSPPFGIKVSSCFLSNEMELQYHLS